MWGELYRFFRESDGPIGMLAGGIVVGGFLLLLILPYYRLPARVESVEKTNAIQENRIERNHKKIRSTADTVTTLRQGQQILICNDPNVGQRWKDQKNCQGLR